MDSKLFLVLLFALFSTAIAENKTDEGEECITANEHTDKYVPLNQLEYANNDTTLHNLTVATTSIDGLDNETTGCCENPKPVASHNEEINNVLGNSHCGTSKEMPRIFGGEVAKIGEFPWLVGIEYKHKNNNSRVIISRGILCTGSLVNKEYVLTAAHCLLHRLYTAVAVRLGEWNTATDPDCQKFIANTECADPVQIVAIREIIPHLFYGKRSGSNNIGLIRLEKQLEYTDFISPICLPDLDLPVPAAGVYMTVAGWGLTENGNTSDILLKTNIPMVSREHCSKLLKSSEITFNQICAGGEAGKDSCQGDGGGPLMYEHNEKIYQHGITAIGYSCGRRGIPAIYTRVSDYVRWIGNVITNYN